MNNITTIILNRTKRYILLGRLIVIKDNVDKAIDFIDKAIDSYKESYIIDDEIVDKGVLIDVRNNLVNTRERVNNEITKLNNMISADNQNIEDYYNNDSVI